MDKKFLDYIICFRSKVQTNNFSKLDVIEDNLRHTINLSKAYFNVLKFEPKIKEH